MALAYCRCVFLSISYLRRVTCLELALGRRKHSLVRLYWEVDMQLFARGGVSY